jgi:metal-responsive CopG/Arc/MetJ family transcriptional regulator
MRASKKKVSVTLDTSLVEWLDKETSNFTFQSRSAGIEKAVVKLKAEMGTQKT